MYNHYLRGLIKNSGLNQEAFARLVGMSGATLSYIISGKNKKQAHRQLIADYFNKPIKTIFKGRVS
jgi:transcriptional regulator with XRE-family HTH domain